MNFCVVECQNLGTEIWNYITIYLELGTMKMLTILHSVQLINLQTNGADM